MPAERDRPPNMLGVSILALILGLTVLGLAVHAKLRGEAVDTEGVFLGVMFLVGSAAAFEHHRTLKAMTPSERALHWARKDAEWRATADAHARSVLGRDYDKK